MVTTSDIRASFLNFFAKNGHEIVASSPLVPHNDPTLLFTNAGMVQFKNVFTGMEQRPYSRAVTSQKCLRAGGKHNDLENVGYTARHHTFFEMLGNFSFGDYFKDLAIEFAWNFVTRELGIPGDRLLVTVFSEDEEAARLWRKIAGLSDDKIIRIPTSDNFWSMGDTGPCGPCSEIFYDHGPSILGGPPGSPDEDGDRFIEIWNLVFMQFEQVTKEERVDLPRPSIDTGMGLERIAAVLQGKHNNYDIDLFQALIHACAEATGVDPEGPHAASYRVIADHLRATSFLIADGVLPSNEGRGYVLRRIMRRGMRHAHMLGAKDPLMFQLVPELVRQMGTAFPELIRAHALITETLKLEEERFKQTLERGLRLLEQETEDLPRGGVLDGEVAFRLYDTYGFPLDLTQDVLRGRHITVDTDRFDAAMERQRAEARAAWAGSGEAADEAIWFDLRERHGATEFLGYGVTEAEGQVVAIIQDGQLVDRIEAGAEAAIILNQTPFYGESGGQVGDMGTILGETGRFSVTDTQKKVGDLFVHFGTMQQGSLATLEPVSLQVDAARRDSIRRNHSATHLLHAALRRTLGEHVAQKGSLVAPERLRFDISHPKPLSEAELATIEREVNARVRLNTPVTTRLMPTDQAIEAGAMALFGEKYGDEVRVVTMGGDDPDRPENPYSLELCGGTHVAQTGDIGNFLVVSESAVAAGVRRVEALTGAAAQAYTAERLHILDEIGHQLRTTPDRVAERVSALLEERRRLEREVADLRRQLATGGGGDAAPEVQDIDGIKFAGRLLEDVPAKDLRGFADDIKGQIGSGIVAIVTKSEGKGSLVVGVTNDLTDRFSAVDLVRAGAAALGGKGGGGRPDMAQAGGPAGSQGPAALQAIADAIAAAA
ncbi:MAG TPA: alanine--tRNA ligase [Alphaproteobacteria bacterium]|nr:alanine--tRNA ligase [Alphaproteobacteria bacterium]